MNDIIPTYLPVTILFLVSFWCSFIICLLRHKSFMRPRRKEVYLFWGNSCFFSVMSNISTLFSITAFLVMGMGVGFAYGFLGFIPTILAGVTVIFLARRLINSAEYEKTFFSNKYFYKGNFSIIDLADVSLGASAKVLCGALILIYIFTFLILELGLVRLCFDVIFPNSPIGSISFIFFFLCILFMYVFLGGFKGILVTDICQLAVIIVAAVLLLLYTNISGNISAHFYQASISGITSSLPVWILKFICLSMYMFCWVLASADFWVRTVFTLQEKEKKSSNLAKKSLYWSLSLMTICALIAIFIGALFRARYIYGQGVSPEPFSVLKHIFENLCGFRKGIVLAALAAACLTTVDTFIITLTQTYFALRKKFQTKSKILKILERLKIFRVPPFLFQTIIFFAAAHLSLRLTKENYGDFFTLLIQLIFFIFTIIICSVYFKQFYTNNFGSTGMILAIFMAYCIILYYFQFFAERFEFIVFVDLGSLGAAWVILAFARRCAAFYNQRTTNKRQTKC